MRLIIIFLCLYLILIVTAKRGGGIGGGRIGGGSRIGGGISNSRGHSGARTSVIKNIGSNSHGSGSGGFFSSGNKNSHHTSYNSHNSHTHSSSRTHHTYVAPRPNPVYTNGFRNTVFSSNTGYFTRTTTNTYIITRHEPYFVYGSYHYYYGPRYYHYHRHSSDMQMCRYVFDTEYTSTNTNTDIDIKDSNSTDAASSLLDTIGDDDFDNSTSTEKPFVPEGGTTHITKAKETFGKVQFQNGTRIKEFSFGCKRHQVCCGLECCDTDESSWTDWKRIAGGIILILVVVLCCYLCAKQNDDEYTVVQQTTTTVETCNYPTMPMNSCGPSNFEMNGYPQPNVYVPPQFYPAPPQNNFGFGYPSK